MTTRAMVTASVAVLAAATPLLAQSGETVDYDTVPNASGWTAESVPLDPFAAPAPFGPGEHLVYRVKVGILNAGYGFMTVHGTEDIRDNPSYRVEMGIRGGIGPLKVHDSYTSWFDVSTFQSWTYIRDVDQVGYEARRHYEFHPDRMEWERLDNGEIGILGSALPLDEIAFIYFMRQMPLEVGKTFTLNRYFHEKGNPVVIEVVRRDQVEVDGTVYNTIVVNPVVQTDGLFGEGGNAEVHFTDDDRRLLVYLKSNIPKFPGSLTLTLDTVQEGFPINPESRRTAMEARAVRMGEAAEGR